MVDRGRFAILDESWAARQAQGDQILDGSVGLADALGTLARGICVIQDRLEEREFGAILG